MQISFTFCFLYDRIPLKLRRFAQTNAELCFFTFIILDIQEMSRERERKKKRGEKMSDLQLEEEARREQRAYMKKWRAENKDKVKKHNRSYWQRKAQKKADAETENK